MRQWGHPAIRNGEYLGEFAEVCTNILRCASEAFDETKTEVKNPGRLSLYDNANLRSLRFCEQWPATVSLATGSCIRYFCQRVTAAAGELAKELYLAAANKSPIVYALPKL
jgi:hypothetical protein